MGCVKGFAVGVGAVLLTVFVAGCQSCKYVGTVSSGTATEDVRLRFAYRILQMGASRSADDPCTFEYALPYYGRKEAIEDVESVFPQIFDPAREEAVGLDVEIVVTDTDSSGGWSMIPFVASLTILPCCPGATFDCKIVVRDHLSRQLIGTERISVSESTRMTLYSPLGLIPYSDDESAQSCRTTSGNAMDVDLRLKAIDVLSETVAAGVVAVLEKFENGGERIARNGNRPRIVHRFRPDAVGPDGMTDAQRHRAMAQAAATFAQGVQSSASAAVGQMSQAAAEQRAATTIAMNSRPKKTTVVVNQTTTVAPTQAAAVPQKQVPVYQRIIRPPSFALSNGHSSDEASRPFTGLQRVR